MATISFEPLFQYIESKSALVLSAEEKSLIQSAFKAKHLRKKQYLLQEGDVCKYMSYIVSGSGKMYILNEKGQEHVIRLAIESWWLGDFESYNYGVPSAYNIEMHERSDVLMIANDQLQELINAIPAVAVMIREIDKKSTVAAQRRVQSSISLSGEERYANFAAAYPEFLLRFPQRIIASYLGISPETLSRIRKNQLHK